MKLNQNRIRKATRFAIGFMIAALVSGPVALAGPDEDQSAAILALQVPHSISYPISFIPGPIGSGAGSVEYGTNIGLKHLPAYMQAPPEVVQLPNDSCSYVYTHNAEQQYLLTDYLGIESWSSPYENSNGSNPSWRFGAPTTIDHYHTDVLVSVRHKNRETGEIEVLGVNPDNTSQNNVSVRMRTGVNLLTWRADTTVTPVLDYVPWHLISFSSKHAGNKVGKAAKNARLKAQALAFAGSIAGELAAIGADRLLLDSEVVDGVYTEVKQRFVVLDLNAPVINVDPSFNGGAVADRNNPFRVRAVDPGGSYFSSFSEELMENFTATDDCAFGEPVSIKPVLTPQVAGSNAPGNFFETNVPREIIIQANDKGPILRRGCFGSPANCYTELDTNETTLSIWVQVEDNEPPLLIPPKNLVVEATPEMAAAGRALRASDDTPDGDPAYIEVGNAAVFDLGDRYPSVDGDPTVTEFPVDARTTINWTATDLANNTADPIPQVITVKTPGTNTTPTASADAAVARVSEPVDITLRGSDPDSIDGVFDPVNFEIARQPENGFLLAPPNPYFIEDYRRTWEEEAVPCEQQPDDSIRFPKQISVTDDGITYVLASQPRACDARMQISAFDKEGQYFDRTWVHEDVGDFAVLGGEPGAFDIANDEAATAREPGVYFLTIGDRLEPRPTLWHWATDEDGRFPNDDLFSCGQTEPGCHSWRLDDHVSTRMATVDSRGYAWTMGNRLGIYELRGLGNWSRLTVAAQEPAIPIEVLNGDVVGNLTTDSNDNLYVVDGTRGRIYKFEPAMSDPQNPIKLIGWMGRCDNGVDCDVENRRSIGFSCTDDTCGLEPFYDGIVEDREAELVACGLPTPAEAVGDSELRLQPGEGCQPGQFNLPTKVEVDANDNLYVADYANRRVQRFTADGGFTGEAKSTCDGSCFVLGDFGRPRKMTVNSFGFYVLDEAKKLLHVFEASPFKDITPNSAVVTYQSNPDVLGPQDFSVNDSFDFTVDDGLTRDGQLISSESFTVNVSVSRNYRAPTALTDVIIGGIETDVLQVSEDTPLLFNLQGRDADVQDEASLTFEIVTPPEHGSVIEVAGGWEYIPDLDFAGDDQFAFIASDGATSVPAMTSEPAIVQVAVSPVPDPVLIEAPEPFEAGIGFPTSIIFDVSDVDSDAEEVMARIDWGDGCRSLIGSNFDGSYSQAISCRREAPDGGGSDLIGSMSLTLAAGNPGKLIAEHLYVAAGDFEVDVCVGDLDGDTGQPGAAICNGPVSNVVVDSSGQTTISVTAKADVVAILGDDLDRDPETNEVIEARQAGVPTNMFVYVRNQQPSTESNSGNTMVATSMATIKLNDDLTFVSIPLACTPTTSQPATIACPIPALAPGEESARIDFAVIANPALAEERYLPISLRLDATAPEVDGDYLWATALPFTMNPVLDPDGDGVPNFDDAFPSDPNEWTDTDNDGVGNNADRDDDGDGLSDTWENRYGLDSLSAADADADGDGDGLTNRMEAMNGTHPGAADSDRDGLDDDVDNCPVHFNQQQHDENGDFLGDSCDARSYADAVGVGDADGDQVADIALMKTIGGASTVYVKDGASDTDISVISAVAEPLRAEALLRIENLEAGPEQTLATVYTDSSGDAHLRTFNAWTGTQLADYPVLDAGTTLLASDVIAANFDELVVLGRSNTAVLSVDYRDARDGSLLNAFEILSAQHEVLGMVASGNDTVAVLAVDPGGDLALQVHRVTDGALVGDRTIGRADGLQARINARGGQLYTLTTSLDGQSQIGVWLSADASAVSQFSVFDATWMPFAVRIVDWASGGDAVAIAASTTAGDIEVRIYDPTNGTELNAIGYLETSDAPRALIVSDSQGGDATISILSSDAGANVSLEQRAGSTGGKLMTLTAASITPPPPPPPPPTAPPPSSGGGGAMTLPLLLFLFALLAHRRYRPVRFYEACVIDPRQLELLASEYGSTRRYYAASQEVDERRCPGGRRTGADYLRRVTQARGAHISFGAK